MTDTDQTQQIKDTAEHELRQLACTAAENVAQRAAIYADRNRSSMPIKLEEIGPILYVVHHALRDDPTLDRGTTT